MMMNSIDFVEISDSAKLIFDFPQGIFYISFLCKMKLCPK